MHKDLFLVLSTTEKLMRKRTYRRVSNMTVKQKTDMSAKVLKSKVLTFVSSNVKKDMTGLNIASVHSHKH